MTSGIQKNRPKWKRVRQVVELLIRAAGPVAALLNAIARLIH
jgi:hypothetical protein